MERTGLRREPLVAELLTIADAGIAAVGGEAAVAQALAGAELAPDLERAQRVFGVAVGKAAPPMHLAVVAAAGEKWAGGIAVSHRPDPSLVGADYFIGEHPTPGPGSAAAGRAVLDFLESARLTADDLVVVTVSGGTSALLALPVPGLTVDDVAGVGDALLRSGVGIEDINAVRRLLSATHNGGVAARAAPARVLGLLMDDTPGAPPEAIGSGPTFPPLDTRARAAELVAGHVTGELGDRVLAALDRAALPEVGDVRNEVVAGPSQALAACADAAAAAGLGFAALPDLVADAKEAARRLAAALAARTGSGAPVCLAASGEVGVKVRGAGRGGRCQQLAWDMVPYLAAIPGSAFVAVATDGRDYLPGVGGAWVTDGTVDALVGAGLSWEEIDAASDTHRGLSVLGQLLPGRATGANVSDLYLAAVRA